MLRRSVVGQSRRSNTPTRRLRPYLGKPENTDTATPKTSPGVRSDQDFDMNRAVATRASEEAPKGGARAKGRGL
eukprot:6258865-Pyramimonas_sp.AAC.1